MGRKVITGEAILSYPHFVTARAGEDGGEAKFGCALIFLKGSNLDELNAALKEAAEEKFKGKWQEALRAGKFRWGIRSEPYDVKEKGYPEGSVFLNARSKTRPGLVYAHAEPGSNPPRPATVPIDKIEDVFYPGAIVRASLTAFAYEAKGNKGVSFGLNNVQFLRDGERLDSRVKAEDEFEATLSAPPANLDDLTS